MARGIDKPKLFEYRKTSKTSGIDRKSSSDGPYESRSVPLSPNPIPKSRIEYLLSGSRQVTPVPTSPSFYAISPIDLIPDFIPVLGHLDDIIILPLLVWLAFRVIPKELVHEHRMKSDGN